jgi:serine/threonine protein kinase
MLPHSIDRYQIVEKIGSGGMGDVYLADDPKFKRRVAIKVLKSSLEQDEKNKERFRREAKAIAQLEHAAVVPVYDYGEEGDQFFIVMRYMEGGSLKERLAKGRLPLAEAARILRRIASALDKSHSLGMIHRDIKPGNILFDLEENPYISDFGLVKYLDESVQLTQSELFGTPAYISPEQCFGDKKIDASSDVYSLAAMFFHMVTGVTPYISSNTMGMLMKQVTDPVPQLADVAEDLPAELQPVIDRGMAKTPSDRYPSTGEMARAVDRVLASANIAPQTQGPLLQNVALPGAETASIKKEPVTEAPAVSRKNIAPSRAPSFSDMPTHMDSLPWDGGLAVESPVPGKKAAIPIGVGLREIIILFATLVLGLGIAAILPVSQDQIYIRIGAAIFILSLGVVLALGRDRKTNKNFEQMVLSRVNPRSEEEYSPFGPPLSGADSRNIAVSRFLSGKEGGAISSPERGKIKLHALEFGYELFFTILSITCLAVFITWLFAGGGEELQSLIRQVFSLPGNW